MEPTKTPVPREAIDAYNLYIHGHIDRRSFLDRVKKVAVSSAAAAAIVDQLMPNYAAAQQVSPTDSRIKTERATVPSPKATAISRGYLVRPANAGTNRLPAILVVHENRGLNPHIEDVARRLALENFMAFAPDGLTSVGGYPGDDEKGGELFGKVDRAKMGGGPVRRGGVAEEPSRQHRSPRRHRLLLRRRHRESLAVRMGADLQAAAPYYGGAPPAADVPKIKAAVLVHHGGEDTRLVEAWPEYASGDDGGRRHARGLHLSGRRPRLQQRRDAAALQQGRGRSGVAADGRVVQQVREGHELGGRS